MLVFQEDKRKKESIKLVYKLELATWNDEMPTEGSSTYLGTRGTTKHAELDHVKDGLQDFGGEGTVSLHLDSCLPVQFGVEKPEPNGSRRIRVVHLPDALNSWVVLKHVGGE